MSKVLQDSAVEKHIHHHIDCDKLQACVQDYLDKNASKVRLDGFRPGKVPPSVIFKRMKDDALQYAIHHLIQQTVSEMTKNRTLLRPVTYELKTDLNVTRLEDLPDAQVALSAFYLPEIPVIDWSQLTAYTYTIAPTQEEVDQEVKRRAENTLTSAPLTKKRPAQKGDTLRYTMAYKASDGTEKSVEGSFQLGTQGLPVEFENALEGIEEGFVLEERIKVPHGFQDQGLAGQKVSFSIKFHEIRQTMPFQVGPEFAQHMGSPDLKSYQEKVCQEMAQAGHSMGHILRRRLFSRAVMETLDFPVPSGLVDEIFHAIKRQKEQAVQTTEARILPAQDDSALKHQALCLVRLECLIKHLSQQESIAMTNEELWGHAQALAHRERTSVQNVLSYFRQNPQEIRALESTIVERKVLEWIANKAQNKDITLTYQAVKNALDQDAFSAVPPEGTPTPQENISVDAGESA